MMALQSHLRVAHGPSKAPEQPECPYWEDGKHCYIGRMYMGDGFIPHQRPIVSWAAKRCACGAKVMPRDGVSSAEG